LFSGHTHQAEEVRFDELQNLVSQLFLETPPLEDLLKGDFLPVSYCVACSWKMHVNW
jgi:hypothetical protein